MANEQQQVRFTINGAQLEGLYKHGGTPVLKLRDQETGTDCIIPLKEEAANDVNVSPFSQFDVDIVLRPRENSTPGSMGRSGARR